MFVGTTDGRVLKIVNTADPSNHRASGQNRPTLVEEIVIFEPGTKVRYILYYSALNINVVEGCVTTFFG